MYQENLRIACILDNFTYECLKYECELHYLTKSIWKQELKKSKPDFLLIESFWEGIDGSWKNELFNVSNSTSEIIEVLNYCKENNIKTVFWNKEDPPNFDLFIKIAIKFDYIFTTDEACIPKYENVVGKGKVFLLPFAAQPQIHNPINKQYNGRIAFAGSWYEKKHFLRQAEMEYLLDGAENHNLDIYDRNYKDNETSFPEKYNSFVLGKLAYDDMVKSYKSYSIFLNANIVFYSKTMFSRRVFEILASGSVVVSSYSIGIDNLFKNIVPMSYNKEGIQQIIKKVMNNQHLLKSLGILGTREVFSKHLYKHRFRHILKCINFKFESNESSSICILSEVTDLKNLQLVLDNFKRQNFKEKKLIIVSNLNINLENENELENIIHIRTFEELENVHLNNLVSIFNENSYYGPNYLLDYVLATEYTKSPILGKASYYISSESKEYNTENRENRFVKFVDLNPNSLFLNLAEVGKSLLLDVLLKRTCDFPENYCYSINMYEFANYFKDESSIHRKININELDIQSDLITVQEYKGVLSSNIFTKGYLGIQKLLENELQKRPMVIYAAGEHTRNLLKTIDLEKINVVGLIDSNQELFGSYKYNLLIHSLDYWLNRDIKCIYISSKEYENEIYLSIKKHVQEDVEILNMYTLYKNNSEDIFKELYLEEIPY